MMRVTFTARTVSGWLYLFLKNCPQHCALNSHLAGFTCFFNGHLKMQKGRTPLHLAAAKCYSQICYFLVFSRPRLLHNDQIAVEDKVRRHGLSVGMIVLK
jgi:hypothetical protein